MKSETSRESDMLHTLKIRQIGKKIWKKFSISVNSVSSLSSESDSPCICSAHESKCPVFEKEVSRCMHGDRILESRKVTICSEPKKKITLTFICLFRIEEFRACCKLVSYPGLKLCGRSAVVLPEIREF
jgi:hypothetical protein